VIVAAVFVASLLAQTAAGADIISAEEKKEGFVALFDGRSLNGWMTIPLGENGGAWTVRDGVLTHTAGDSWIATAKTYTDFVLRLEYRTGADSDSGIFMRSTPSGYPSFTGMEIEIKNDPAGAPGPRSNTSLYGAAAPRQNVTRADGAWNVVEISVIKRRLVAIWNGETIHDLDLDDPAYAAALRGPLSRRAGSGRIGFQAHATGTPVEFRHIRVKVVR
jgi:Domain of Unknown Function (DUF1080)